MNINSIDDYEKFLNIVYEGYKNKLLEFKKDDIEFYKNNNEIKKLKTKEGYYFYVAKNAKSIVSFASASKKLCDTFTMDSFLDKLKGVVDKQIRSYNPIIYKDILESSGLVSDSSDYFLIPSNPKVFDLEGYVDENKGKELTWGEKGAGALLSMKSNSKVFFYIARESLVCFYGVVKEIKEDGKFIINKIQKLEKTISLNDAREYGFKVPQRNQNFYNMFVLNYLLLANNLIKGKKMIIDDEVNIKNPPLNQILYGPPGTGKTYHTIDKALEIILKEEKIQIPSEDDRVNRKKLFDEYIKNGQIVFTTFHQSYGYEEFVEGIKPVMDSEQGNSKEVEYEIKDGVFKELCKKANKNYLSSNENNNELDLDKLIFEFANYINQNFINKGDEFPLENRVNIKEILLNSKGEYRSFLLGGSIKSPQRLTIDIIKRDYLNFKENKILDYKDIKPKYESQSDYHGNAIYYFMFYKKLKEFENTQNVSFKNINEKLKPYIIIIDEINRGNVSKIFGELITLIEPSKRIGESEELKITLPYSGEKFGVPKNVYIIGTMNTADRSITSLDTALRRRFEFVEMMPDVSKLSIDCEGVNLQELLKAINTRIEYLLDREKTIGHAFFISIDSLEKLKNVFQNKIIPLLQEYFYNNYALIDAVLNNNGMIFEDKKDNKYLQKIKNLDNVDNEKNIYNITSFNDEIWDKPETYQAIYDDEKNKTKNDEQ
nr:AAA family ATPase [Campylobacter sp. US33a]